VLAGAGVHRVVAPLDVDGQLVVVNAAYGPSSASDTDKLTSMVESLEFPGNAEWRSFAARGLFGVRARYCLRQLPAE
jgi:hypothetical protein